MWYHWRSNLAMAVGVVAAAAVLTGALTVGDSMRESLQRLALDRLGPIEKMATGNRFFRADQADQKGLLPAILLPAVIESPAKGDEKRRVAGARLFGVDNAFYRLAPEQFEKIPEGREIVLNRELADQLGVVVGDPVVLRLSRPASIPAETPLGRRDTPIENIRLRVVEIVPDEGLGRFAVRTTQRPTRNAWVPLAMLQRWLDRPGRINTIFSVVKQEKKATSSRPTDGSKKTARLTITADDLGWQIGTVDKNRAFLNTERMLFEPRAETALLEQIKQRSPEVKIEPVLTYLVESIRLGLKETPYATVAAIDFDESPLGPWKNADGKPLGSLEENQIVLNRWAADDLKAKTGDQVRLSYFEPESVHGRLKRKTISMTVAGVVPMEGPAVVPGWTPRLRGVTDQLSMADWDPPFEFDATKIRDKDEAYWDQYRATPKAFVSLATGRKLWGSRFGKTTTFFLEPSVTSQELDALLSQIDPSELGLVFQPIREEALAAAQGATPFGILFLALSFFVIASALLLIVLLFRLGVDSRERSIGLLRAVGWPSRRLGRLLAFEGWIVAALGSLLGAGVGLAYGQLMLFGLHHWWQDAIGTRFLTFSPQPMSLILGPILIWLLAAVVIAGSVRRLGKESPRRLLDGRAQPRVNVLVSRNGRFFRRSVVVIFLLLSIGFLVATLSKEQRGDPVFFFLGSVLALVLLLWGASLFLRSVGRFPAIVANRDNHRRLAWQNAGRHPWRSLLVVGLIASTTFLLATMDLFRFELPETVGSGVDGFTLVAESDLPIYHDPGTKEGWAELGFSPESEAALEGVSLVSLRVLSGNDASCLNLYQARRPRILGVPESVFNRTGFTWVDSSNPASPWHSLEKPSTNPDSIPMVLEKNTANYALQLWRGLGETYETTDETGRPVCFEVAGLLSGSILQGNLLVAEADLLSRFPEVKGYQFFLIDAPPEKIASVKRILQKVLGDYGLSIETSQARLARFMAIQNTYLSAFQSLGLLGLLLGTLGLGAVVRRNLLERRRELALLQAVGFSRRRLIKILSTENTILVGLGVGIGYVASLAAFFMQVAQEGSDRSFSKFSLLVAVAVLGTGWLIGRWALRGFDQAPLVRTLQEE